MLAGVEKFQRYARRGGLKPVMIAELRPTVYYDELRMGDWKSRASEVNRLDLANPNGELRISINENLEALVQTTFTAQLPFNLVGPPPPQASDEYAPSWMPTSEILVAFLQTFTSDRAIRLAGLEIGLFNEGYAFTGQVKARIVTDFQAAWVSNPRYGAYRMIPKLTSEAIANAVTLWEGSLDCSQDEVNKTNETPFRQITCAENVWIPGGGKQCGILLWLEGDTELSANRLWIRVSGTSAYEDGWLFSLTPKGREYETLENNDLAFRILARGFWPNGEANFILDLGASLSGLDRELAIPYRQPEGTSVLFKVWESASGAFSGEETYLGILDDGSPFTKRYLKVRVEMTASSDQLESPRVFGIRAQAARSIKFCLAGQPLFGYPNLLASPPEYSASGSPLEGDSSIDDSRLVFSDPGGMVTEIFKAYGMKNDRVIVRLGFDADGYEEEDFIPYRTLVVEDWERDRVVFVVHCIDSQMRLKQAEYPVSVDPPSETEEVHFDLVRPGELVRRLLECAQIRKSQIDAASFASLDSFLVEGSTPWRFNLVLKPGDQIKEKISQVMSHVPGFVALGQDGIWRAHWIDFEAAPVVSFDADQVKSQSTLHQPNLKDSANIVKIFFGGSGNDEADYARAVIGRSWTDIKAQQQLTTRILKSEILPADRVDVASTITMRLLALTKEGIQTLTATGGLESAALELGDTVSVECEDYFRKGAVDPNPILCQVTRAAVLSDLTGVEFTFQKLLDAEESPPSVSALAPPSGLAVEDNGDGSATWTVGASPDEPDVAGYELYERINRLHSDFRLKETLEADGSPSYEYVDSDFSESLVRDFAVRAVASDGRKSAYVVAENVLITKTLLDPPVWTSFPVAGGIRIRILQDVSGAAGYLVYVKPMFGNFWREGGVIGAGILAQLIWVPDDPYITNIVQIRLASINQWGKPGPVSSIRVSVNIKLTDSTAQLAAAEFDDQEGAYPQVVRKLIDNYWAYSIKFVIQANADELDDVLRFEVQRRDDGGTGKVSWSSWQQLPDYLIKQGEPAPKQIIYENTDRKIKPEHYYQFRVRGIDKSGLPGEWSESIEIQIAKDTTAPDKPTFSVTALPTSFLLVINAPLEGGVSCNDFAYFKIEGNKGSGWVTLAGRYDGLVYQYPLANASAAETWQFRVTAYDTNDNASTVSDASTGKTIEKVDTAIIKALAIIGDKIAGATITGAKIAAATIEGSNIKGNTVEVTHLNFTPLNSDNVIASINASEEGIKIEAAKLILSGAEIVIDGSCTFGAGYDPTSKVAALGGAYNSADSGARVRIFPDAKTGIQITDGTNDVFKAMVGGEDVGDLIIGDVGNSKYLKWDKSAGALKFSGSLEAAGAGPDAQNQIQLLNTDYGQLNLYSGGEVRAYLRPDYQGTGYGGATLYLQRDQTGGKITELIQSAHLITIKYDSTTVLTLINDTALGVDLKMYNSGNEVFKFDGQALRLTNASLIISNNGVGGVVPAGHCRLSWDDTNKRLVLMDSDYNTYTISHD